MTYEQLIESIKNHYYAEDWVHDYPKDISSDNYSYFQDAALEIAAIAYHIGQQVMQTHYYNIGVKDN